MIKQSFNLTDWQDFGLEILTENFPRWNLHRETENYKVFYFRLITPKSSDKIFWKLTKAPFYTHFEPFLHIHGQIWIFLEKPPELLFSVS